MTADTTSRIQDLEEEIRKSTVELAALRQERPREDVQSYTFTDPSGRSVPLSSLFGDRSELILVHNMGTGCSWCTMWADGFNGVLHHITSRAAFAVTSPDPCDVQKKFAEERPIPWRFPMYSVAGSSFIEDMGFWSEEYGNLPGVSAFVRDGDRVYRTGRSFFDEGDNYCPVWHLLYLLPTGVSGWEPQISYGSGSGGHGMRN